MGGAHKHGGVKEAVRNRSGTWPDIGNKGSLNSHQSTNPQQTMILPLVIIVQQLTVTYAATGLGGAIWVFK